MKSFAIIWSVPDDITAEFLRDQLVDLFGNRPSDLVLDVKQWASFVPAEWHVWFTKYWNATTSE